METRTEDPSEPANANEISGPSRLVMMLFGLVFIGFGLRLLWDLLAGLSR